MMRHTIIAIIFLVVHSNIRATQSELMGSQLEAAWRASAHEDDRYYVEGFLDLVGHFGYEGEKHFVVTDDNIILSLFRIKPKNGSQDLKNNVIYLQCGTSSAADIFVALGPSRSLAFSLSDAGFDVWMGNVRGKPGSRGAPNNYTEQQFWSFSLDEYGVLDLPAFIDYILKKTHERKLMYIVHIMSSQIFALLSEKPEYNEKLEGIIHLAPVAYWKAKNNKKRIVASNRYKVYHQENREKYTNGSCHKYFLRLVCYHTRSSSSFCGDDEYSVNDTKVEDLIIPYEALVHSPLCVSWNVIIHYVQQAISGTFGFYDYGAERNQYHYSRENSPQYNISSLKVPTLIFSTRTDNIATIENTEELISKFPIDVHQAHVIINNTNFETMHFLIGRDAKEEFYTWIIRVLKEFLELKKWSPFIKR